MVDLSRLRNPYDHRNPVSDADRFAGRDSELSEIKYVLKQAGPDRRSGYVALYGQRAAGKTSLLNMVALMAEDLGQLSVRLHLVPGEGEPRAFFRKVLEELVRELAKQKPTELTVTPRSLRHAFAGRQDEEFPLEFPESVALARPGEPVSTSALAADLAYLGTLAGRPIVLLVDEAQLATAHTDTLSILRTLGNDLDGYVFVLAGTPELLDQIGEVFSHLTRQFTRIKVQRFTEVADVRHCMYRPLAAVGLGTSTFENLASTAADLLHLTDGNPYEIQMFCHEMFARWQTGRTAEIELSAETLESVRARSGSGSTTWPTSC